MGQYWKVVNLDKREYLNPHTLGAGIKLWEQLANHPGPGTALIILCAAMPERRGGGDLALSSDEDPSYEAVAKRTIGRWSGNRIALVGDYACDEDLPRAEQASTIYGRCIPESRQEAAIQAYPLEVLASCDPHAPDWFFKDITEDVCRVIEVELQGKYTNEAGWRSFKLTEEGDG